MLELKFCGKLYRKSIDFLQHKTIFAQGIRYVIIGIWNTFFGLGTYALLIMFFGQKHYILLSVPNNILAITNAYLCYKFLVFKTRGNYLKEYLRCYEVYGMGALIGMGIMYLLVNFGGITPVMSNIISTFMIMFFTFLGHRFYSFRKPTTKNPKIFTKSFRHLS